MFTLRMATLAAALGLAAMAPASAQDAPPGKKDCSGAADVYERLACRQEAIADQLDFTVTKAFADGTKLRGKTSDARLEHVKNAKRIADRAKDNHKKDLFKRHARTALANRKGGGHLVPLSASDDAGGDGICDFEQGDDGARCAAVEPDDDGNLQACNPAKKNKGKAQGGLECDLALEETAATTAELADAATELDDTYVAAEASLVEMNQQLVVVNESEMQVAAAAAATACTIPAVDSGLAVAVPILHLVEATLDGIASGMDSATGQDAFGFNARGVAFAFDVAHSIANVAYVIAEEILNEQSGAVQDATMACVVETAGEVAALQAEILQLQVDMRAQHNGIMANDNANTATIMGQLEDVRRELVDVLNTPQGQRGLFPLK